MNYSNVLKVLVSLNLLIAFAGFSAAVYRDVDSTTINNLPSEKLVDEEMSIFGEATGEGLTALIIWSQDDGDGNFWDKEKEVSFNDRDCDSNDPCTINYDYTASSVGTKNFRVEAEAGEDISGESSVQKVKFTEATEPSEALKAKFTASDTTPEVGQEVEFDSSSSTGDIQERRWFFDDGDTGSQKIETHTFTQTGTFDVRLVVEDSSGDTSTATREITVSPNNNQCAIAVSDLRLDSDEIFVDETTDASLSVSNIGRFNQSVNVKIFADNTLFEEWSVNIDSGDSRRVETPVSSDDSYNGEVIQAEVETSSDECSKQIFNRYESLTVFQQDTHTSVDEPTEDSETDAELEVQVRDEDGDDLNARVTTVNGDDEVKSTGSDGKTTFSLHPDEYRVTVSKTGYETKTRTIDLEAGEKRLLTFVLERDGSRETDDGKGLEISSVSYPDSVCRGGSFSATVEIDNLGGFHEIVTVTGSGFGKVYTGESFALEQGETRRVKQIFTDIGGSGVEEFDLTATNHDSDSVTRTIKVEECGFVSDDTTTYGTASSVSMEVNPRETVIGNSVMVKGYVDGVRGRTEVDITINGVRKASVSTQPDGYYQVFVTPDNVGEQTVTARSGGETVSRTINMIPTSTVLAVTAPEKVFEGETFEVCADVSSQITPKLFFTKDNRIVETRYDAGDVCFEKTASDPGLHQYEISSLTYGIENSASTTVEVLETKAEVTSFPDKIATVETEEGLLKVELYNSNKKLKRYHVELQGIPSTWSAQTEKEVILAPGESRTVYFYLSPRDEGDFKPTITVESSGSAVFQQEIEFEIGGSKGSRDQTLIQRILDLFNF